eukprot:SAG31_NODE_1129_length_9755_cov_2.095070_9_plen_120_part_00
MFDLQVVARINRQREVCQAEFAALFRKHINNSATEHGSGKHDATTCSDADKLEPVTPAYISRLLSRSQHFGEDDGTDSMMLADRRRYDIHVSVNMTPTFCCAQESNFMILHHIYHNFSV